MISYLTGKIIELDFNKVVLLTSSGVGYDVHINEITYGLISEGEDASFFIHHHITEGAQSLFGFLKKDEKKVFEALIKISGVGGKVATQILSLGIPRLIEAIGVSDNKTIESIKGIGKKMAEKIILELKDKDFGIDIIGLKNTTSNNANSNLNSDLNDSIKETLSAMGYNIKHVEKMLLKLPEGLNSAEDIIHYVVKNI